MSSLPTEHALADLMAIALDEARAALAHDDVPIGAVVARLSDGAVIASAHNEREGARRPDRPRRSARVAGGRARSAAGASPVTCWSPRSSRARCARAPRGRHASTCSCSVPPIPRGSRRLALQPRRRPAAQPRDPRRTWCAQRRVRGARRAVLRWAKDSKGPTGRAVTSRPEGCESGRIGWSRKPLWRKSPWVQIPLPPPSQAW